MTWQTSGSHSFETVDTSKFESSLNRIRKRARSTEALTRCGRAVRFPLALFFLDLERQGKYPPILRLTYSHQTNAQICLLVDLIQRAVDSALLQIRPMYEAFLANDIALRVLH